MADTFDIVAGSKTTRYASASEAGRAYFEADSALRPSVFHSTSAVHGTGSVGSARFMAETSVYGSYDNGETRYMKHLPDTSRAVDKDFRAGYVDALDKSVNQRLKTANWDAAKPDFPSQPPKLDPRLNDDLTTLSQNDVDKAAKAWESHAPDGTTAPAFVDRESKRRNDEARHHQPDPDATNDKNTIEPVREPDLQVLDGQEAVARANLLRRRESDLLAGEQERLGSKAEGKRIDVENLSEKARDQDAENDIAERTGSTTDRDSQLSTEREKNRQIALMDQVHGQFRVAGARFHFKDQPGKLAFKDNGARIVTASNDDRVARAMATMADAKGWKTINVSGHPDFRREVWMEANLRGIAVRGFKPTEQDLKLLDDKRERAMHNTVEQDRTARERSPVSQRPVAERQPEARERGPVRTDKDPGKVIPTPAADKAASTAVRAYAGRILDHGTAPFNHDPEEKANYFVTLATDKGEKTVWGIDLKRAIAERRVQSGDEVKLEFKGNTPVTVEALERDKSGKTIGMKEITTHRNRWDVQKSEKARVAEAVAAVLIDTRVGNPALREALKVAVGTRMAERETTNRVPAIPVYDKAAPARSHQQERTGPVVERNAERTRQR